ncbi:hypothetical protein Bbelb_322610 [Branchiostoma belcheri]|nr:hypothetical protein Bbelb_322610 [Branchiostoma belcheri]
MILPVDFVVTTCFLALVFWQMSNHLTITHRDRRNISGTWFANMKLRCLVLLCIATVGVAQRWRTNDLRCGPGFVAPDGNMAECGPKNINPCCSWAGWCGSTDNHCTCTKCVDYRVRPLTCGDLLAAGKTTSAFYPLYPNSSCLEPIWVYCAMEKNPPFELLDLPPENGNFAKSGYNETLRDIIGYTNFSKVKTDFSPCGVNVAWSNTDWATTTGRNGVGFGSASDCFPRPEWHDGVYRPVDNFDGEFRVDLTGTETRLRDDVYWGTWGNPSGLWMTNFSMSANRTIVTAKCGGYCGGCAPALMWLVTDKCTPLEVTHQIVYQPPDQPTALCLQLNLTFAPCDPLDSAQKWRWDGGRLLNSNTSLCLDIDDIDNPTAPVLRDCAKSSSLLWPFEDIGQDFYSKPHRHTCDALYGYIIRINKSEDGALQYHHTSNVGKRIEGLEVGIAYQASLYAVWSGGISQEAPTLTFGTRPSRPGDFNVSDVTEHTISLNWTASIGDVVEYRVNCVPADGDGKKYWKRVPWDSLNHTCTGLDSGVMYNVSVAAGTALRMGRPARDAAITLLAPPTDLKVIKATTSTLTLNWTAGTPASRLHFYTVQVCFLPPSTQTCPYVEENAENNATQLEIKELQPTSGYNISLVASGYYEDSDPIKIQGATLPQSPDNITSVDVTTVSFKVLWDYVTFNGLLGFNLNATASGLADSVQSVGMTSREAFFSGLQPATIYRVEVTALSTLSESEPTVLNVTTAGRITATSVDITWTAPIATLQSYRVQWTNTLGQSTNATISSSVSQYSVTGLSPVTRYNISLYAVSHVGQSVPITITVVTETDPPKYVRWLAPTLNSITLQWIPPQTDLVNYNIAYRQAEGSVFVYLNPPPGPGDTGCVLEGLLADTLYVINISAVSTHSESEQVVIDASTGVNVALGKTADQTSTLASGGAASRAVDGNTNTVFNNGSCTHTQDETGPSWWVDLGQPYMMTRIVIFNRQDCCSEQLNPFNIHIGDSSQVSTNPKCGGDHLIDVSSSSVTIPCPGMRGRYVGVRLPGPTRTLTLCEVLVFGDPLPTTTPAPTTASTSTLDWSTSTLTLSPSPSTTLTPSTLTPVQTSTHFSTTTPAGPPYTWLTRDVAWVVDSAGIPSVFNGVTYDAQKALDEDWTTYWNPSGEVQNYNNWYIVLDLTQVHTLIRVGLNNMGDVHHDIGSPYNWVDVLTVDNVQGGTSVRQEFGGFQGTERYWKFVVTRTFSGFQPWLRGLHLGEAATTTSEPSTAPPTTPPMTTDIFHQLHQDTKPEPRSPWCIRAIEEVNRLSTQPGSAEDLMTLANLTRQLTQHCKTTELNLEKLRLGDYTTTLSMSAVSAMADRLLTFNGTLTFDEIYQVSEYLIHSIDSFFTLNTFDRADFAVNESEAVYDQLYLTPRERYDKDQQRAQELSDLWEKKAAARREATRSSVEALDKIASALLSRTNLSTVVSVVSYSIGLHVGRSTPAELSNVTLNVTWGSLTFPPGNSLFGSLDQSEVVDFKTTEFIENPFVWDETADSVRSSVLDLDINSDNGTAIRAAGLQEDFVFMLLNPTLDSSTRTTFEYVPINNRTINNHPVNVTDARSGLLINVLPSSPGDVYHVYIGLDFKPNSTHYIVKQTFPALGFPEETYSILLVDIPDTGLYNIGVERDDKTGNDTYTFGTTVLGCRWWDEEGEGWSSEGCRVGPNSNINVTECLCNHLTAFGADFITPPNSIDFSTVFAKFADLSNNPVVFSTVIVIVCLYLIALPFLRRQDKKDLIRWQMRMLPDNGVINDYFYHIAVFTGNLGGAGTTSRVSFNVMAETEDTGVRIFDFNRYKGKIFQRGGVDNFIMATEKCLGPLQFLRLWHDNSGKGDGKSWYIEKVVIQDLQTDEKWFFIFNKWLAVEKDDGLVDRIAPTAGKEELTSFLYLFFTSARQNLSDGHLWLSVFSRPTRSYFTRVQRWSCCVSILFTTMIANAMWYRTDDNVGTTTSLRLGPLEFTLHQLWVSVMSTLTVIPVNVMLVQIFRSTRPKDKEERDKHLERAERWQRKRMLPHWFVYVGWVLVFLVVSASAFFTILYSMEWGADKANKWFSTFMLSFFQSTFVVEPMKSTFVVEPMKSTFVVEPMKVSANAHREIRKKNYQRNKEAIKGGSDKANKWFSIFMLSFFQSTFVVEPMKVMLVALAVSSVCKRPLDDKSGTEDEGRDWKISQDHEWHVQTVEEVEAIERLKNMKPPRPADLEEARRRRETRLRMHRTLKELAFFTVFVTVLLFITSNNTDPEGHFLQKFLREEIVDSMAKKVNSSDTFWWWLENTFVPAMYPTAWYNGEQLFWQETQYMNTMESFRIGPPRVRVLRTGYGPCPTSPRLLPMFAPCVAAYSWSGEDTGAYGHYWAPLEGNKSDEHWRYQTSSELEGLPVTGTMGTYRGGGYVATLGTLRQEALTTIRSLKNEDWIDRHARAVFVEFTVYNANINLFSTVTLLMELILTGGTIHSHSISVYRLFDYVGSSGYLVLAAQIIFVLFLLYFIVHEYKKLKKERLKYFKSFWNSIEFVSILLSLIAIALFVVKFLMANMAIRTLLESKGRWGIEIFVNFQRIAFWDAIYTQISAILVFINIMKFMRILVFSRHVAILQATINAMSKDLLSFIVMFMVAFLAFCQAAYILFHVELKHYCSLDKTLQTTFVMMLGKVDIQEVTDIFTITGPVFMLSFMFSIYFLLMNFLMSIVCDSIGEHGQGYDVELVDLLWNTLSSMVGVRGRKKIEDEVEDTDDLPPIATDKLETVIDKLFLKVIRLSDDDDKHWRSMKYKDSDETVTNNSPGTTADRKGKVQIRSSATLQK